ncbi:type II toxin-antitoxin system VapC family toxin [Thiothrix lacustris]|uniref:Type II toxin-antitoxin system VapC family toxin n=1 Tax=Thiothrix lacustris TaxID=525917 RepID=A0ABY9MT02_9GAMM|nr:type II toxin-antitoxin system VapC family toxin [Thiothrix lacustris]WML91784.1 type II toxin-antitoxin system VapC family toxin [Thiothrix lacustris]
MLEQVKGKSVYFDTNPFIYFVEGHEIFFDAVKPLFEMIDRDEITACTGELTLTELLIKPYRDGAHDIVAEYEGLLLHSGHFSVFGLSMATFLKAAKIGGETLMRTPDALHMATALENNCDFFVTNDKRIRSYQGVTVIQVLDLLST